MNMNKDIDRWHRHFLGLALYHARMSKDPDTQVGAIIVGPSREIRSAGFNGFPMGILDNLRLKDRPTKMRLIVHAEMNAVLLAARVGVPLDGCTMYIACTDSSGMVWAGPPCTRCAMEIIQSGINRIVYYPRKQVSRWKQDIDFAASALEEAGILLQEVSLS